MISPIIYFLIIIAIIIALSKYELSIVLFASTLLFAILVQVDILETLIIVFSNPSVLLLALAVALIAILGGIMEESGLMLELIQKMKVSKKVSLMITPAFYGLLPVAGGALMSAPIVEKIDVEMNPNRKVAINVWFRHVLIFIYPLSSALIVGSILANISLYLIIIYLIIPFLVLILIGYYFLVRNIDQFEEKEERDLKKVAHNLLPIIVAPIIDFIGRTFFNLTIPEIFLVIGLGISIIIALRFARMKPSSLKYISKKMKIWRFPILIFAMFLFLEVFIRSGVPEEVKLLNLPFILFVCIGFFLGFATGRIQIPLFILIPIYLIQYGLSSMILADFILIYISIFLGYLITPIHPCVAYSIEYFKTEYKNVFKFLALPSFACFGIVLIFTFLYMII